MRDKSPPDRPFNVHEHPNERRRSNAQILEEQRRLREESGRVRQRFETTRVSINETWERLVRGLDGAPTDRDLRRAALNLLEDTELARLGEEEQAASRERAEAAERASEARYRTLFDSIDEGFCTIEVLFDEQGKAVDYRFLENNPAFLRQTGLEDAVGKTMRELAPDHEEFWFETYGHIARTGEAMRFEHAAAALGRFYDVYAFRVGEENRVAILFKDISQRKSAEEALRESQERLRLVVDNAREYAIISMDLQRRIASWNSGAQRIVGYAENEARGQSADLIFTPEDRANHVPEQEAEKALAAGRAIDERWHLRKDGSRFWASGVMTAMHDAAGAAIGLVKIFRDHTEERLAKQALEQSLAETEQARREAEEAGRAKDHFLAVLSHELRTPLTPVMLATELIERSCGGDTTIREAVEMIRRNVAVEARFIKDLLDVTRIGHGKFEITPAPLDLHQVIGRAVANVQPEYQEKEQRLKVALDAAQTMVSGDDTRLEQVACNLLKNASKFTPEEGRIEVRTFNEDDDIVIEVTDSGIGIDAAEQPLIFDAFAQANQSISQKFGGLGLGLAIAKAIVDGHGGELRVHSRGRDQGATFCVRLPLLSPNQAHPAR